MRFFSTLSLTLLTLTSTTTAKSAPKCLSDKEADTIAANWLKIWSTGGVTTKAALLKVVSPDIANYDETYGAPNLGIDELYAVLTAPGNYTTQDIVQSPLFTFHSCDQIAVRWSYTATSTGFEAVGVPAGTPITLKGIELLHVYLESRLIFNATSSADWIQLSREIGQTVNV